MAEAADASAELIIAHHPVLLRGISAVTDDHPKGRLVRELVRHDISVFVAHQRRRCRRRRGVGPADALELIGSRPMLPALLNLDKIIVRPGLIMPKPSSMHALRRLEQVCWATTTVAPLSATASVPSARWPGLRPTSARPV